MENETDNTMPFCQIINVDPKKIKIKRLPSRSLENGTIDVDDSVSDEDIKNIKLTD